MISGLQPGERVVTDGTDRLRDGAKVTVPAQATAQAPRRRTGTAQAGRSRDAPAEPGQQASTAASRHQHARPAGQQTSGSKASRPAGSAGASRASRRSDRADGSVNPSRLFILRPVGTTLLMAAILLVGIVAYRFLPISALPEVDYPTIQVQTFYPGASPEVMTSSVTSPLEVQFGQMPGLNQMFSTSSAGASVITLQFSLDLSLDIAEQEVQAAINAAGNLLPSDLPAPPIYAKVNPADAPILTLALTSKTLPLTAGRGHRRHAAGAEDLAAARRRAGQHQRRPACRRCACRSIRARWRRTG